MKRHLLIAAIAIAATAMASDSAKGNSILDSGVNLERFQCLTITYGVQCDDVTFVIFNDPPMNAGGTPPVGGGSAGGTNDETPTTGAGGNVTIDMNHVTDLKVKTKGVGGPPTHSGGHTWGGIPGTPNGAGTTKTGTVTVKGTVYDCTYVKSTPNGPDKPGTVTGTWTHPGTGVTTTETWSLFPENWGNPKIKEKIEETINGAGTYNPTTGAGTIKPGVKIEKVFGKTMKADGVTVDDPGVTVTIKWEWKDGKFHVFQGYAN